MAEMDQFSQMFSDPVFQKAFADAKKMVDFSKSYNNQLKQEKMQPITDTLTSLGNQYKIAQTDEQRQALNKQANKIRTNLLIGGYSPTDLPTENWGSDLTQGFQTNEGFEAPITGFEGLGREKAIEARRQAFSDFLEREKWNKSKENQDWYLPLVKQSLEADIANTTRLASGGGGSSRSGSGSGSGTTKTLLEQAKLAAQNDPRLTLETDPLKIPEGKYSLNQLVDAYMSQLGGGSVTQNTTEQPTGNAQASVQTMINQLLEVGATADEIHNALLDDGIDPAIYGY